VSKSQQALSKGPKMEELLRSYFLKAGYYVVRGVPFVYEGLMSLTLICGSTAERLPYRAKLLWLMPRTRKPPRP